MKGIAMMRVIVLMVVFGIMVHGEQVVVCVWRRGGGNGWLVGC